MPNNNYLQTSINLGIAKIANGLSYVYATDEPALTLTSTSYLSTSYTFKGGIEITASGSITLYEPAADPNAVLYWIEVDGNIVDGSSRIISLAIIGAAQVVTLAITTIGVISALPYGLHTISLRAQKSTADTAQWRSERSMTIRRWP
jgi:hypothetical protein